MPSHACLLNVAVAAQLLELRNCDRDRLASTAENVPYLVFCRTSLPALHECEALALLPLLFTPLLNPEMAPTKWGDGE